MYDVIDSGSKFIPPQRIFADGYVVRVRGLKKRHQLNGKLGQIWLKGGVIDAAAGLHSDEELEGWEQNLTNGKVPVRIVIGPKRVITLKLSFKNLQLATATQASKFFCDAMRNMSTGSDRDEEKAQRMNDELWQYFPAQQISLADLDEELEKSPETFVDLEEHLEKAHRDREAAEKQEKDDFARATKIASKLEEDSDIAEDSDKITNKLKELLPEFAHEFNDRSSSHRPNIDCVAPSDSEYWPSDSSCRFLAEKDRRSVKLQGVAKMRRRNHGSSDRRERELTPPRDVRSFDEERDSDAELLFFSEAAASDEWSDCSGNVSEASESQCEFVDASLDPDPYLLSCEEIDELCSASFSDVDVLEEMGIEAEDLEGEGAEEREVLDGVDQAAGLEEFEKINEYLPRFAFLCEISFFLICRRR